MLTRKNVNNDVNKNSPIRLNFNACSTRNVQPAGRVYFPLPDSSRKIEGDSARRGMLLILGTGSGEPGTGVWEQVYSGNPLESSKWRTKQKKRLEEKQFELR